MIKTVREFQDDLKALRAEMYQRGEFADTELVASWLDRLIISLDKLSVSLDLMAVEVEVLSKRPSKGGIKIKKAAKKKTKKKAAKKKAKKKPKKKAKKATKKKSKKKRRR